MIRDIVQLGAPVLRARARPLVPEEIATEEIQRLLEDMRETMRGAPGVGLAAPQIGVSLQIAVIEDRPEYTSAASSARLTELEREPVPFHVLINPEIVLVEGEPARFFEGCLSLAGFAAVVPRARVVRVQALNERAEPITIEGRGWYARILQHEIDHLRGTVYVDRMLTRTLGEVHENSKHWGGVSIEQALGALEANRPPDF